MIKISDYIHVKKKAQELGCNIPTSIALLPRNFANAKSKDELIHEMTISTVRVLWQQNAINETPLEKSGERFLLIDEKAFEWIAPVIFISAAYMNQSPNLTAATFSVISSYLIEWFRGIPKGNRKVKFSVIVETKREHHCKRIDYEGSPEGLKDLPKVIREVNNNE